MVYHYVTNMTLPHDVTMTIGTAINLSFRDAQSLNGVSFRIVVLSYGT